MTPSTRYDTVAITLHWLSALAIVALLAMGWIMTDLTPGSSLQFSLYQWHKSVGITVLALTVLRLAWALTHRPPPLPTSMPAWEQLAARLGHLGLYGLLFAMPLLGWAVVSTSPFNIPTVLYGALPLPHLPGLAELPDKKAVHELLKDGHELGALALVGLLCVHIAAALRHHFVLRDGVLMRMVPPLTRAAPPLGDGG